jgi:hypothetical protein
VDLESRMTVSDIVFQGEIPQRIRSRLDAWAGCIAGALEESDYLGKIRTAGFEQVEVQSRVFLTVSGDNVQVVHDDGGKVGEAIEGEEVESLLAEAGISLGDLDQKVASIRPGPQASLAGLLATDMGRCLSFLEG